MTVITRGACAAAATLYEFDNEYTAPLHGFRDTDDYWARASGKPWLQAVRIPYLVLNARNDPFVPESSLPQPHDVSAAVELEQPARRGPYRLRPWPVARPDRLHCRAPVPIFYTT